MSHNQANQKWANKVTKNSHALELEDGIFTWEDPKKIAKSLKKSAFDSENRKGSPYQSAVSMLNFYINRAGTKLSKSQKNILEHAKKELAELFDKN